jgi:hypothetical protein
VLESAGSAASRNGSETGETIKKEENGKNEQINPA